MGTVDLTPSNKNQLSDADIVKRVLAGDKALYEILLRRNNQKLYRVLRSYFKNSSEVQDIMQNTYLKAYEKLYQFKHESAYSTWLIRIGINEALTRLREKGRVHHINDANEQDNSGVVLQLPDTNQADPEKIIIRQEAKRILENAIDSLDEKYRTVYILKELEDMSMSEIANCLDISLSNVKVRLHRSRAMLKEQLYELSISNDIFEFGSRKCDLLTERVMRIVFK